MTSDNEKPAIEPSLPPEVVTNPAISRESVPNEPVTRERTPVQPFAPEPDPDEELIDERFLEMPFSEEDLRDLSPAAFAEDGGDQLDKDRLKQLMSITPPPDS